MPRDEAGIESLPVVLLLGAVLAVSSVAIGFASVDRAQRLSESQRSFYSFEFFVERAQLLSAGGIGGFQIVDLDLGDCVITVDGNIVQLISGVSVLRSETVALELLTLGGALRSGSYMMEVVRSEDGRYALKVEGI